KGPARTGRVGRLAPRARGPARGEGDRGLLGELRDERGEADDEGYDDSRDGPPRGATLVRRLLSAPHRALDAGDGRLHVADLTPDAGTPRLELGADDVPG